MRKTVKLFLMMFVGVLFVFSSNAHALFPDLLKLNEQACLPGEPCVHELDVPSYFRINEKGNIAFYQCGQIGFYNPSLDTETEPDTHYCPDDPTPENPQKKREIGGYGSGPLYALSDEDSIIWGHYFDLFDPVEAPGTGLMYTKIDNYGGENTQYRLMGPNTPGVDQYGSVYYGKMSKSGETVVVNLASTFYFYDIPSFLDSPDTYAPIRLEPEVGSKGEFVGQPNSNGDVLYTYADFDGNQFGSRYLEVYEKATGTSKRIVESSRMFPMYWSPQMNDRGDVLYGVYSGPNTNTGSGADFHWNLYLYEAQSGEHILLLENTSQHNEMHLQNDGKVIYLQTNMVDHNSHVIVRQGADTISDITLDFYASPYYFRVNEKGDYMFNCLIGLSDVPGTYYLPAGGTEEDVVLITNYQSGDDGLFFYRAENAIPKFNNDGKMVFNYYADLIDPDGPLSYPYKALVAYQTASELAVEAFNGTIAPDENIHVQAIISNAGNINAINATVSLYTSDVSVFDGTGILVGTQTIDRLVRATETTLTWNNTTTDPLGSYFHVVIDETNAISEFDETNNARSCAVNGCDADMAVTSVAGALSANQIVVSGAVDNVSGLASVPTKVGVYLSQDNVIETGDIYIGEIATGIVEGNGSFTFEDVSLILPDSVPAGDFYIGAIVNYDGSVPESNLSNNALAGNLISVGALFPDLIVTAVSGTEVENLLTLSYTIKNIGRAPTSSTIWTGIYLSQDQNITSEDSYIGAAYHGCSQVIQPGAIHMNSFYKPIPATFVGQLFLGAIVNYNSGAAESDESNNELIGNQLYLGELSDIVITSFSGAIVNGQLSFIATVKNQGFSTVAKIVVNPYLLKRCTKNA